jgi:hypothetical protein
VCGIALSVARPPFPSFGAGLAWVSTTTVMLVGAGQQPAAYQVEMRLSLATAATAFAAGQHTDPLGVYLATWPEIRLPLPAALGTRSTGRRPARTLLTAGAIAVAIAMATAALASRYTFTLQTHPAAAAADNALVTSPTARPTTRSPRLPSGVW